MSVLCVRWCGVGGWALDLGGQSVAWCGSAGGVRWSRPCVPLLQVDSFRAPGTPTDGPGWDWEGLDKPRDAFFLQAADGGRPGATGTGREASKQQRACRQTMRCQDHALSTGPFFFLFFPLPALCFQK